MLRVPTLIIHFLLYVIRCFSLCSHLTISIIPNINYNHKYGKRYQPRQEKHPVKPCGPADIRV